MSIAVYKVTSVKMIQGLIFPLWNTMEIRIVRKYIKYNIIDTGYTLEKYILEIN